MKPPSILIADDSEEDVFFLQVELKARGILNPLQVVTNGEETIRYLGGEGAYTNREKFPMPVLMLLDLKMPRKTGFEVLEWMKQRSLQLPVIVLSVFGEVHQISRVYQLGARGFVVKPVPFQKLLSAIRSVRELELKEADGTIGVQSSAQTSPMAELAVA